MGRAKVFVGQYDDFDIVLIEDQIVKIAATVGVV